MAGEAVMKAQAAPSGAGGSRVGVAGWRLVGALAIALTTALLASAPSALADQRLCTETLIKTSDGVRLHAWVSRSAPDVRRPVLFMMDSYSRSGTANGTTGATDGSCPTALPDDYVPQWLSTSVINRFTLVQVAYRGTGASEGVFDMTAARTQQDIQEAIDWTSTQVWSDGSAVAVGESGTAFFGFHALRNPHIKAALLFTSCADMYRCFYRGGQYNSLAEVYLGVTAGDWMNPNIVSARSRLGTDANPTAPEQEAGFGQALAQTKSDAVNDAWWQQRSALNELPHAAVPVMYTTDLYDIVQPFDALQVTPGARFVFGMGHQSAQTVTNGGSRFEGLVREPVDRFLAHFGLGDHNGAEKDPRVTLVTNTGSFAQFQAGRMLVRGATAWPLPGTNWTRLYLGAGPSGSASSLNDGTLSDAATRTADPGDTATLVAGPHEDLRTSTFTGTEQADLRNEERGGLTYTTPVLKHALEVSGPLALRVFATATASDFDWSVRVADVWPDGSSQWITDGYLRASLRRVDTGRSLHNSAGEIVRPWLPYDSPLSVPLGDPVEYQIDVIGTSNVFAPGHRLRLDILPAGEGGVDSTRTGGSGSIDVLRDPAHPSYLMLPVIPGACERGAALAATTPHVQCAQSYREAIGIGGGTVGRCVGRRSILIHLRAARHRRLRSIRIYVGGRLARVFRGRRFPASVRVTSPAKGNRFTVRIVRVTTKGRRLVERRHYLRCAAGTR
jgi:putative CocE/NonD family hydrolase